MDGEREPQRIGRLQPAEERLGPRALRRPGGEACHLAEPELRQRQAPLGERAMRGDPRRVIAQRPVPGEPVGALRRPPPRRPLARAELRGGEQDERDGIPRIGLEERERHGARHLCLPRLQRRAGEGARLRDPERERRAPVAALLRARRRPGKGEQREAEERRAEAPQGGHAALSPGVPQRGRTKTPCSKIASSPSIGVITSTPATSEASRPPKRPA